VLAQAAGFALLAAISPTALVVMAVFLGSANPRQTAMAYVFGAFVMTALMAVALLLLIRVVGLDQPRERDPRYGLRLGLGVLALLGSAFLAVRRARRRGDGTAGLAAAAPLTERLAAETAAAAEAGEADQAVAAQGFMARLVSHPSPRTAFITGLILFAPSLTFIAAVQVIASARTGTPVTVFGLLIVIVLSAVTAWVPLLAYLSAPKATERRLAAGNGWLRARSQQLVIIALLIAGVALVANGALGLAHAI
jgi:hypothetical protein